MKKRLFVSILFLISTVTSTTAEIPENIREELIDKGFSIYPEAVYCTGDLNSGVRFAVNVPDTEVRAWYKNQYPKWAVLDLYGSWVLHNASDKASFAQVMAEDQIMVQENLNLPAWHSLPNDMTTEIMAVFPE